jgi:thiol-disulfide isomerase/thioredoxin
MRSRVTKTFICSLVIFLLSGCAGDSEPGEVAIGRRPPSFSLQSLDGGTVTSRSLEGNVVVLNFWATWCATCAGELPDLKQVAAGSGAKVVGIALDEGGAETVKPFVESHGISQIKNFTVLIGDQELFQRFDGAAIPYTLLLDRSQRVVKIYRGPVTKDVLEKDLKAAEQGAVPASAD